MNINNTIEKNTLILISLLKQHNIRYVIASPGGTNVTFVASVQNDPFFTVYSAVDERAAAYMACGLSEETGEAVVLSCTGATSSRNYVSGLTEAYKKHLPILAVTASQHLGNTYQFSPQQLDRSVQSENVVKLSVQVPTVVSANDEESTITNINNAILELWHNNKGPVHLNMVTLFSNDFSVKTLPQYRVINRILVNDVFPSIPSDIKICVFVGAHSVFDKKTEDAIEAFCEIHNAIVICDQTSNYRGKHRVLANLLNDQEKEFSSKRFDLVIHIGYISGAYIIFDAREIWRVNPDGIIRDTYRKMTYVFEMEEYDFFSHYSKGKKLNDSLLNDCQMQRNALAEKIPELPFSNLWIASQTASLFPDNSVLHLGILNTLRSYNYFETNSTVSCYSNTGGFGIDGCVSSLIGAALVNPEKEYYGIVGDLAFFYDQNSVLANIPSNVHIMVINNGMGAEFKTYNHRCVFFGEDANDFIAAQGHNGCKSVSLLKNYASNSGIRYLTASSKEEYRSICEEWLAHSDTPVILEVFTSDKDECEALRLVKTIAAVKHSRLKQIIKRSVLFKIMRSIIKK